MHVILASPAGRSAVFSSNIPSWKLANRKTSRLIIPHLISPSYLSIYPLISKGIDEGQLLKARCSSESALLVTLAEVTILPYEDFQLNSIYPLRDYR